MLIDLDKQIEEIRTLIDDTWEDSQLVEEWIMMLQMREAQEERSWTC